MRRPGADEWKQLVEELPASGLSQKEFCSKHDINLSTLQYWLYVRNKRRSGSKSGLSAKFLPIEVVASPASSTRAGAHDFIELGLRNGTLVRFVVGTDVRYLAELLSALG
jgi:hypothetical protein